MPEPRSIGPETEGLVIAVLHDRPHPEQGFRTCLGVLALAKSYDANRLDAAELRPTFNAPAGLFVAHHAGGARALTDAVEERPDIDASRTAAMGGSFGGYMANWVAGHTDRFRAIVTHASR